MVHECINCGAKLDKIEDLVNGCPKCGSKYFKLVVLKDEKSETSPILDSEPLKEDSNTDSEENKFDKNNIESVLVKQRGIYEVNLDHLLEKDSSIVFADEDGNYVVDINSLLKKGSKKKKD